MPPPKPETAVGSSPSWRETRGIGDRWDDVPNAEQRAAQTLIDGLSDKVWVSMSRRDVEDGPHRGGDGNRSHPRPVDRLDVLEVKNEARRNLSTAEFVRCGEGDVHARRKGVGEIVEQERALMAYDSDAAGPEPRHYKIILRTVDRREGTFGRREVNEPVNPSKMTYETPFGGVHRQELFGEAALRRLRGREEACLTCSDDPEADPVWSGGLPHVHY